MQVPYEGGPVVYCPIVYTSFWGHSWNGANAGLASQLNQFMQDLMACQTWMNVLTQYGVAGTGAFAQASFLPSVPQTLTVPSYQAILQSCINAGVLPEPSNVNNSKAVSVVIVFLDQGVVINGGGRQLNFPGAPDAGYHDSFTTAAGNPFLYAFIEFTDLASICSIVSHEFAEMITDPLYNAWTPDHAGHEIGDYCSWQESTITVSGRTWTIQKMWSNAANSCVAGSATKTAALQPGPGGAMTPGLIRLGRGPVRALDPADVLSHHRVLPLPSVQFNHETGEKTIADPEIMAYARKMFSPLRHDQLVQDFPGLLRQAAAVLESRVAPAAGPAPEAAGPASGTQPDFQSALETIRRGVAPKPEVDVNA